VWNPEDDGLFLYQRPAFTQKVPIPTAGVCDPPLLCMSINAQWMPLILGALSGLVQPSTWDTTDPTALAAVLAQAQDLLDAIGTAMPCNDAPPSGVGPGGTQQACNIAGYIATALIHDVINRIVQETQQGQTIVNVIAGLLSIIPAIGQALAGLLKALYALNNTINGPNLSHYQDALGDPSLFGKIACAIYGCISADGQVTDANFPCIITAVGSVSYVHADVITAIVVYLGNIGAGGLESLQLPGVVAVYDCSACGAGGAATGPGSILPQAADEIASQYGDLGADLPLTFPNVYYPGPMVHLAPGGWTMQAAALVEIGASNTTIGFKLWDGVSPPYAMDSQYAPAGSLATINISSHATQLTAATARLYIAAGTAGCTVHARVTDPDTGQYADATYLIADAEEAAAVAAWRPYPTLSAHFSDTGLLTSIHVAGDGTHYIGATGTNTVDTQVPIPGGVAGWFDLVVDATGHPTATAVGGGTAPPTTPPAGSFLLSRIEVQARPYHDFGAGLSTITIQRGTQCTACADDGYAGVAYADNIDLNPFSNGATISITGLEVLSVANFRGDGALASKGFTSAMNPTNATGFLLLAPDGTPVNCAIGMLPAFHGDPHVNAGGYNVPGDPTDPAAGPFTGQTCDNSPDWANPLCSLTLYVDTSPNITVYERVGDVNLRDYPTAAEWDNDITTSAVGRPCVAYIRNSLPPASIQPGEPYMGFWQDPADHVWKWLDANWHIGPRVFSTPYPG
jgi:hypothetical protein